MLRANIREPSRADVCGDAGMAADSGPANRSRALDRSGSHTRATYNQGDLTGAATAIADGIRAELQTRYRRSFFGPFWMTLSSGVTVFGLGALWSQLWDLRLADYYPYLAAGFVTWTYLATILTESTLVFVTAQSLVKNTTIPLFVFPMRSALRQMLLFLHQAPVIAVVFLIFGKVEWTAPLALVGFLLIYINSIWIAALAGMIGARFRDLSFIVEAAVPLLLFMTPVLWRPEDLGENSLVVALNPFAHALAVVRDPLLGKTPDLLSYSVLVGAALAGWLATAIAFRHRQRIPFWV
jgi:ABC-type polysaccharide/polyol phosphate export permease